MKTDRPVPEDIKSEALSWVARIKSGEATRMDAHRLSAWRAQSPAHEEAFREAADLWRKMGGPAVAVNVSSKAISRRMFLTGTAAAGVAGIAVGGSELGLWPGLSELMVDHRTAVGEQRTMTFADGTLVDFNTRTGVSVEFGADATRIDLAYGEAAFRSVGDRPLLEVRAGAGKVSTSSAAMFAIRILDERTQVTCFEGRVDVFCITHAALEGGQQVLLSAGGLGQPVAVNTDSAAAWRKGMLVFENRSLADVVTELNRYRRGRIFLTDSNPRRVNGIFHLARPDEALEHLAATFDLRITRLLGGVVLLG